MPLIALTGRRPKTLGVTGGRLSPVRRRPNSVSSDATDAVHAIDPLPIEGDPAAAWKRARQAVLALPRTRIVSESAEYLHAECQSRLLGFVDDLELHLRPAERRIAVRSASRLGRRDFGVNRARVEDLRARLRADTPTP